MNDLNKSFEERLEIFFERAVTAWLVLKDEAGLVAALAAAKTFNPVDRQVVVTVLDNLHHSWSQQDRDGLFSDILKSLGDLKEIIMSKDWTPEDGLAERNRLKMVSVEYEEALVNGDPDIFARKYPDSVKAI
jgi:hypothetical protein